MAAPLFPLQLTAQAQEDRSYEAVSERSTPAVEFRGERRPVEPPDARSASSEVAFDPDALLVHGCRQIINLFIPVSFCMLFVVIISRAVPFYSNDSSISQSFTEGSITGKRAGDGVVIALVVIGFIILATCIMVLCFKFRCMRVSITISMSFCCSIFKIVPSSSSSLKDICSLSALLCYLFSAQIFSCKF